MLRVMPPMRAKRCGDCHHQQPLPHPNGHDEHEDSLQFNIVSHDYHDQRMDTDGAGVLGDSLRVSGLDPPDDDDASRVDGLNSDALKQITNKGVHHNNKMDEPKNENSTEHSDEHNPTAEPCLPTWTHPTKPTSYQHRHFLNEQQDKRCYTELFSWRRIHSLSYITPEYSALNCLSQQGRQPLPPQDKEAVHPAIDNNERLKSSTKIPSGRPMVLMSPAQDNKMVLLYYGPRDGHHEDQASIHHRDTNS